MGVVDRHGPGVVGLLLGSLVIATYRVLALPMTGSPLWAWILYSGTIMWPLLLFYAVVVSVERSILSQRVAITQPARQAFLATIPVFSIGFLATNGIPSRIALATGSTMMALVATWMVAAWFDSRADLEGPRRVARTTQVLVGGLLITCLIPLGGSDDLVGLESMDRSRFTGRNIVVLAADGMDWSIVQRLVDQGEAPHLASLIENGTAGPLHTIRPTSSPFIWNSIYTGFSPALHKRRPIHYVLSSSTAVGMYRTDYPDSARVVLEALKPSIRHPRAIWDSLTAVGYDSAVLGSWEQEPVPKLGKAFLSRSFEFSEHTDPDVVPEFDEERVWIEPSLEPSLRQALVAAKAIPEEEWEQVVGSDFPLSWLLTAELRPRDVDAVVHSRLARLRSVYMTDRFRMEAAKILLEELDEPFFLWTYLMGLDTTQHSYTHQLRGVDDPNEPPDVVEAYYRRVDGWLGEIVSRIPDETVIVVVSDHGVDVDTETVQEAEIYKTGSHAHAPHGVLIVRGPGVEAGKIQSAHVFDVAPTLLALVGVPNLAAVEGRVITEVTAPTTLVADWHSLTPTTFEMGNPEFADPKLVERLRQLGYVR